MKISDDGKTICLDIRASLDANQLDTLLHGLAMHRAGMTPAVPTNREAAIQDGSQASVENGQGAVIARRRDGGFRLWLRHRGFGWLAWEIDDRFASGLANYIAANTVEDETVNLFSDQAGNTAH